MRNILILLGKDLRDGLKNGAIIGVALIPIVFSLFFHHVLSRFREQPPSIAVRLPAAGALKGFLSLGHFENVRIVAGRAEAEELVRKGKVRAALFVPDPVPGEKLAIELIVDRTLPLASLLVEAKVKEAIAKAYNIQYPVDVKITSVSKTTEMQFLLDFWIFMLITMISLLVSPLSVIEERYYGTLRALLLSPATARQFIWSKVAFALILSGVGVSCTILVNGAWRLGNNVSLAAVIAVGIFPLLAIGLFFPLLLENQQATVVFLGLIMGVFLLGAFLGTLVEGGRWVFNWLPTFHTYTGIKGALFHRAGIGELYPGFAVPLAWGIVFFLADLVLLKRKIL
jgi:ABC-type transport system involved in multi-copper enzyme maturation permease subunit